jgi:osmoprotectant transport system permease protein
MIAEMMLYIIERSQDFTTALSQHLYLTFLALGISLTLGVGFGVLSTRINWLKKTLLFIANIGRTIPSLAILALALPLLGIGTPPTMLALVLIGTLPILINTTVGIEQVDESIKEAARGMGMTNFQVLLKVELPIAVSVIMAGIRTSAVLLVASATLAAFIGAGGLGDMILRGHALTKDHIILAGAIPATLLAFYFEETFGRLEKWATPIGLKVGTPAFFQSRTSLIELLTAVLVLPIIFGVLSPWITYASTEGKTVLLTGLHAEYRLFAGIALVLGVVGALFISAPQEGQSRRQLYLKVIIQGIATALLFVLLAMVLFSRPEGSLVKSGSFIHLFGQVFLLVLSIIELRAALK